MLVKELVESQQITGAKALTAVAALGYHIKTPTKELLHELIVSSSFLLLLYIFKPVNEFK